MEIVWTFDNNVENLISISWEKKLKSDHKSRFNKYNIKEIKSLCITKIIKECFLTFHRNQKTTH